VHVPNRGKVALAVIAAAVVALAFSQSSWPAPHRSHTLRRLASNPRYFTDGSGRAVYLAGSHVWWNLVGGETWGQCFGLPASSFDYQGYLNRLHRYGHNFVRLWRIGLIQWRECGKVVAPTIQPWRRVGPKQALDGRPRLDLKHFDESYFSRLRARVAAADRAGVYVSVMLFESWASQFAAEGWAWRGSPYNPANNSNGINADVDANGSGVEAYTLAVPAVTRIEDAYVRKVVDTVNSFDNVLYEIANEAGVRSTPWQYHMISLVKSYERHKPKQHPVGMTYEHGDPENLALLRSGADWIAPIGKNWVSDPPPASGGKVAVLDTDHLCGVCGGSDFVWKSFARGYNPIFMDPFDGNPERESARVAMGQTRALSARIALRSLRPRTDICSTRYCLARPRYEIVVYQPRGGAFSVTLGSTANYRGEWLRPGLSGAARITVRGSRSPTHFEAPWPGAAVLHLRRVK